jgi:predicted nucleic acid-binding protein
VEEIMAPIDRNDTAFFATAMGAPCDGIWSDDRHLKLQKKVKVWRTKDVLEL